jgi:hypothetical protein
MARGPSGRLVIDIDPALKRNLHSALAADGTSLKDWFLKHVLDYFADRHQPKLPGMSEFSPRATHPTLRAADDEGAYESPIAKL